MDVVTQNRYADALERIAHSLEFLARHFDPGFKTLRETRKEGRFVPQPASEPDPNNNLG